MAILLLVLTILGLLVYWIVSKYNWSKTYWKKKNVKFLKPVPIFGNFLPACLGTKSIGEFIEDLYKSFPNERYMGIFQFGTPILLLRDPELIKQITIKDFEHFINHTTIFSQNVDSLWGKNLFASQDDQWINLRRTLSPAFTTSKMRFMFELINDCGNQLVNYLKNKNENLMELEMKDFFSRSTNDMIATTAFGIKIDSHKNRNNEFLLMGQELTDFTGLKRFKFFMYDFPELFLKIFNIKMVNDKVATFFRTVIKQSLDMRSKSNVIRPDLLHLLIEARKGLLTYEANDTIDNTYVEAKAQKNMNLTDEDIAAQSLIFFFGGFDTTSTLMAFICHELAINPDIQARLLKEVDKVLVENNNKVSYTAIQSMKYLDMVVSETVRKWSQALFVDRVCNKPFTIEPELPHEKPVHVKAGSILWIPIFAIHRDPKYYDNPDTFDPERFSDENKWKINKSTYLPFGSGPRNCIGSRYALMVCKMLAFHILSSFEMVTTKNTKLPLEIDSNNTILAAKGGFWYGLKRRNV